jgi:hypothetical protein
MGRSGENVARQRLIVPYARRDEVRAVGAAWDAAERRWTIERDLVDGVPRDLLPIRDRPGLDPPYIRINLVPQTSWGRNVRALVDRDVWRAFAREKVYATTGFLCLVCGGRGDQWPVEADEVWHFDDAAGVQRLAAVVPLCPSCHEVRSCGLATTNGRAEHAARHLAWVERIGVAEARLRIRDALAQWRSRSRRSWRIDVSLMATRHGIDIAHDPRLTDAVNAELLADARRRSRRR